MSHKKNTPRQTTSIDQSVDNRERELETFLKSLHPLQRKQLEHGFQTFTQSDMADWIQICGNLPDKTIEYEKLIEHMPERWRQHQNNSLIQPVPNRRAGAIPSTAVESRRKIVNAHMVKPSDFKDRKRVAVLSKALDDAQIPLPNLHKGTYSSLRGELRRRVIETLKKDLQRFKGEKHN